MLPSWNCVENLSAHTAFAAKPWELSAKLPDEFRANKTLRIAWSMDPATKHQFYSGFFGKVKSLRVGKTNEACLMVGFALDVDAEVPAEALIPFIEAWPDAWKPRMLERTLSGKSRLIWTTSRPWAVAGGKHVEALMKILIRDLGLGNLPKADLRHFVNQDTTYLFNHADWYVIGDFSVPEPEIKVRLLEAFEAVEAKNKLTEEGPPVDFNEVAERLRAQYPRFATEWTDFAVGVQGTSFWVDGSVSPKSAIVKAEGMLTFADHAPKAFFSWSELLGPEYAQMTNARDNLILTKYYYNDVEGNYYSVNAADSRWQVVRPETLKVELKALGIRAKAAQGERLSELEVWMDRIRTHNRVSGTAPFMFNPSPICELNGERFLNSVFSLKLLDPAPVASEWGPNGRFPVISYAIDQLMGTDTPDKECLLAVLKCVFEDGRNHIIRPRQIVIITGAAGVGKTFLSGGIAAGLLGGVQSASHWVTGKDAFGAEVFSSAHINVDDAEMGRIGSEAHRTFTDRIKSLASRTDIRVHAKYKSPGKGQWGGLFFLLCNDDANSLQTNAPDFTSSIDDKVMFLRVINRTPLPYSQPQLTEILSEELPYFAAWLLQWTIPEWLLAAPGRYQLIPYKNAEVMSEIAGFRPERAFLETLAAAFKVWFRESKDAMSWKGTIHDIQQILTVNSPTINRSDTTLLRIRTYMLQLLSQNCPEISRSGNHWIISKAILERLRE